MTDAEPMITNPYGVRYRAAVDDHPTYTFDVTKGCNASAYGGDHTCACVYRKTIEHQTHLCMCGAAWDTEKGE